MTSPVPLSERYALDLDTAESLRHFRNRFHVPQGAVYLDGSWLILWGFAGKAIYSGSVSYLLRKYSNLDKEASARNRHILGQNLPALPLRWSTPERLREIVAPFFRARACLAQ